MARDWLQTVRNILALAERAATQEEADAAMARAQKLIADHGIDEALLDAEKEVRATVSNRPIFCEAPYATDKAVLLNGIFKALGCEVIYTDKSAKGHTVRVYGFDADIDRAEILYTSLLLQAMRWMLVDVDTHTFWGDAKPRQTLAADRRSWLSGFTSAVVRRIEGAENRAKASAGGHITSSGKSTDLVLVERSALVRQAFTEAHPNSRKGSNRTLRGNGYSAGRAAGERANIGQRGISAGRRALAGS